MTKSTIACICITMISIFQISCDKSTDEELVGQWEWRNDTLEFFPDETWASERPESDQIAGNWTVLEDGRVKLVYSLGGSTNISLAEMRDDKLLIDNLRNSSQAEYVRSPGTRVVDFSASNEDTDFSIRGRFEGKAEITSLTINLLIEDATLFGPRRLKSFVESIAAGVACADEDGWDHTSSRPYSVRRVLVADATEKVDSFKLVVPRPAEPMLEDCWLVFEIAVGEERRGYCYAHTKHDLFRLASVGG
jgi:hypothetical protein